MIRVKFCCSVFASLFFFLIYSCSKNLDEHGQAKRKEYETLVDNFFLKLRKIKTNSDYFDIYSHAHAKMFDELKESLEESGFWEKNIETVFESLNRLGPGLALKLESYANDALQQEIQRVRQEANIIKLQEREQKIAELEKELSRLKTIIKYQTVEIDGPAEDKKSPFGPGVPVVLINTGGWPPYLAAEDIGVKITKQDNNKSIYCLVSDISKDFYLPTGQYSARFYGKGVEISSYSFSVIQEPAFTFNGRWYHGQLAF